MRNLHRDFFPTRSLHSANIGSGDHRATKGAEARGVAVGVDEELGDVRAQTRDDMSEKRAPGECEQRLFSAHAGRSAARENNAGDGLGMDRTPPQASVKTAPKPRSRRNFVRNCVIAQSPLATKLADRAGPRA